MPVLSTEISFDLHRGETQLWAGAPRQGIVFREPDLLLVAMGLSCIGYAVAHEVALAGSPVSPLSRVVTALYILIGLCVGFGRMAVDARRRRRMCYGLTSERVIIENGSSSTSLPVASLDGVSVVEGSGGCGDVTFGAPFASNSLFAGVPGLDPKLPPMFEMIPDAGRVCNQIQEAQRMAMQRDGVETSAAPSPRAAAPSTSLRDPASGRFVILVIFGVLGALLVYAGATDWYAGVQSTSWPTVAGTIIRAKLTTHGPPDGDKTYSADFCYRYDVEGRSFVGTTIAFGDRSDVNGDYAEAQRRVDRYPLGTTVTVHYDSARPDRAVLQPNWTWDAVSTTGDGLLAMLMGFGIYRMLDRRRKRLASGALRGAGCAAAA